LLCKSTVESALNQIESTVEDLIVGIIEGAINGFVENANVTMKINTFLFTLKHIFIGR